jgi:hypothetical protein
MSIEEQVRQRQVFEAGAKLALEYLSALNSKELEIVLARVADQVISNRSHTHLAVFGRVIKIYFELRSTGLAKQSKSHRRKILSGIRQELSWAKARSLRSEAIASWEEEVQIYNERKREWSENRNRKSWFQRFLDTFPYQSPTSVNHISFFVTLSEPKVLVSDEEKSEALISKAAKIELPEYPFQLEDIGMTDIQDLLSR